MEPVRLGIVGVGWGANHARVAAELAPHLEVRALCGRRPERARALAEELGLPAASVETDWQRLVGRDDVDLVVITAPDYLHHPITLAAIGQGKHVFCDKPLAMHAAQARDMLDAAAAAGVAHFTGFTWRFAPPFATIRRLLDDGALGDVWLIDGHFRIGPPLPGKAWQFDPQLRAGGVLGNLGVHLVDLARYLGLAARGADAGNPDSEQWRVWARCQFANSTTNDTQGLRGSAGSMGKAQESDGSTGAVNDITWLHVEMGRVQARLQVSQLWELRAAEPVRVEVHGTRRTAIGYANPLYPQRQRVALVERISEEPQWVEPLEYPGGPPSPPTAALPSGGLLRPTIRHLYEAHVLPGLRGAAPSPATPTFYDGWVAQRIMDASLRSAQTGSWQSV